ncbi:MAG TPA: tripartite tricarboxylate transporter substrate binding protein [Pseudoduganella sp.]
MMTTPPRQNLSLFFLARPAVRALATFSCGLLTAAACHAQAYPVKPIRLIVPFAPGGTTDGIARVVASKASEYLGQPVVVENKPGAGGNVGADLVAKAAPDGYTLAMIGNSFTVNPTLYRKMPFKQSDLTGVVLAGSVPFVMVSSPKAPFKSAPELLRYARENPGKVTYASGGSGTIGHLGAHWFGEMAGIQLQHIPYKGGAQAMTDLIGDQVQIFFDTLVTSTPFIKSAKVVPLFVTTPARLASMPGVPTAIESGFPDLTFSAWVGVVAPAGTPPDVLQRLNRDFNTALGTEEVVRKLAAFGADPIGGSLQKTNDFLRNETARWGAVVRKSGAEVD